MLLAIHRLLVGLSELPIAKATPNPMTTPYPTPWDRGGTGLAVSLMVSNLTGEKSCTGRIALS